MALLTYCTYDHGRRHIYGRIGSYSPANESLGQISSYHLATLSYSKHTLLSWKHLLYINIIKYVKNMVYYQV
jgi:hypothetical protein